MEQLQILQEERINTPTAEANLWLAVIDQAIEDLWDPDLREAALEWFASTSDRPASFRWICDYLDLNASAVCARLTPRQGRQNLHAGKSFHRHLASGKPRVISKPDGHRRFQNHRDRSSIAVLSR